MKAPTSWLSGIAKVLRAETGDLRELARIGGADPRTAYIGTNLTGVDLRGQDLRGMLLPDLDLKTVKTDAKTLLDGGREILEALDDCSAMVYVAIESFEARGLLKALNRGTTDMVFGLGEEDFFLRSANSFPGPKLILVDVVLAEHAARTVAALRELHIDYVCIAMVRARPALKAREAQTFGAMLGPIVFVPRSQGPFGHAAGEITPEVRDLISLLLLHWDSKDEMLEGRLAAYFFRARGVGQTPELDASAQIFDRCAQMGLSPNGGVIVDWPPVAELEVPDRSRWGLRTTKQLWNAKRLVEMMPSKKRAFDVAVLAPAVATRLDERAYVDRLGGALQSRGWRVEYLTEKTALMLNLAGDQGSLGIVSGFDWDTRPSGRPLIDFFEIRFDEIERIVLSPSADVLVVAERLVERRELWVNGRDLLGLSSRSVSVWTLIASQLKRVARSASRRAREAYVDGLLYAVLNSNDETNEIPEGLRKLLGQKQAGYPVQTSISGLFFSDDRAGACIRLVSQGVLSSWERLAEFEIYLWIDGLGPRMTSEEMPPGDWPRSPPRDRSIMAA